MKKKLQTILNYSHLVNEKSSQQDRRWNNQEDLKTIS